MSELAILVRRFYNLYELSAPQPNASCEPSKTKCTWAVGGLQQWVT